MTLPADDYQPEQSLAEALGYTDEHLGPQPIEIRDGPRALLKPSPFSESLEVPEGGTIFVGVGKHGWERASKLAGRALAMPHNEDPSEYVWPVRGCGVIVLDYQPLTEHAAMSLAVVLSSAGAEPVIWSNQVAQDTSWLIKQKWNQ